MPYVQTEAGSVSGRVHRTSDAQPECEEGYL